MFHKNCFEQNLWNLIFSSKCNILGTLILAKPINTNQFMMFYLILYEIKNKYEIKNRLLRGEILFFRKIDAEIQKFMFIL